MVNHVRTLLLNRPATGSASGYAGEEYVPPTFKQVAVSSNLQKVRKLLFGTTPDRYMLNFRLRQYMPLLHESELAEFVTSTDSRISYLPFDDSYFSGTFGLSITGTEDFATVGTFEPDENAGKMFYNWDITVTGANTVHVKTIAPQMDDSNYTYTLTDNRSNQIQLDHSTLKFTFTAPVGSRWFVEGLARPTRTIADIWQSVSTGLTQIQVISLFGASPSGDYLTWYNVFKKHLYPEYKLGAVLLALAARTYEESQP